MAISCSFFHINSQNTTVLWPSLKKAVFHISIKRCKKYMAKVSQFSLMFDQLIFTTRRSLSQVTGRQLNMFVWSSNLLIGASWSGLNSTWFKKDGGGLHQARCVCMILKSRGFLALHLKRSYIPLPYLERTNLLYWFGGLDPHQFICWQQYFKHILLAYLQSGNYAYWDISTF